MSRAARMAAVLAVLLAAAPGAAAAPEWAVNHGESRLGFVTSQSGAPVTGRFESFTAAIRFSRDALADSRVEIVIDMASVTTGSDDRDKTIRSASLFHVEKYPRARFVADRFERTGEESYIARGELTIRDTTRPVELPFELAVRPHPEKNGVLVARTRGEITIKRLDYGVGQGQWRDTSMVPNEVTIRFDLRATRPQA